MPLTADPGSERPPVIVTRRGPCGNRQRARSNEKLPHAPAAGSHQSVNCRREKPVTMPGGPVSGDDAHDLIDDALAKLAMRSGAWLSDDITAMTLITSLIDQAARFLPELVTNARLNGHSW